MFSAWCDSLLNTDTINWEVSTLGFWRRIKMPCDSGPASGIYDWMQLNGYNSQGDAADNATRVACNLIKFIEYQKMMNKLAVFLNANEYVHFNNWMEKHKELDAKVGRR